QCYLRNEVCGIAKSINSEPARIAGFAVRSITDQAGAKKRCAFDVIIVIRQMKTESRIGDGELGVTAVDGVTSETRVIAQILPARSAVSTFTIGPAEPWNADTISDLECGSGLSAATVGTLRSLPLLHANGFDMPDNLMPWNQR